MKITLIKYRELQSHNYESEAVEMTAEVGEGEDVPNAMVKLREAVRAELAAAAKERDSEEQYSSRLRNDIYSLDSEKRKSERELEAANNELKARVVTLQGLRELFDKLGVEFTMSKDDISRYLPMKSDVGENDESTSRVPRRAPTHTSPEMEGDDCDPFAHE